MITYAILAGQIFVVVGNFIDIEHWLNVPVKTHMLLRSQVILALERRESVRNVCLG